MTIQVRTGTIRCGYVHIVKPRINNLNKNEEYSMQLIIPKNDPTAKILLNAIQKVIAEKWGNNPPSPLRLPLRDADAEKKGLDHLVGCYFTNVKSQEKPGIVDTDGLTHPHPEDCRSGDYFRVTLGCFAYEQPNNGVSFGLNNVQFVKQGDTLSGRKRAEDDFPPIDDTEDSMLE